MADEVIRLNLDIDSDDAVVATSRVNAMAGAMGQVAASTTRSANQGRASLNHYAMGFNALAQGVEDFQFSVQAGMNNLAQSISLLTGSAGLAAAATVAGVAINQLYNHWGDITAAFGHGGTFDPAIDGAARLKKELEEVSKQIDTLESGVPLTFWENQSLGEARTRRDAVKAEQATQAAAESLMATPDAMAAERAAGIKEAIAGVGPSAFGGTLRSALDQTADRGGRVVDPATGKMVTVVERMNTLLAGAEGGDLGSINRIQELISDAFGKGNPIAMAIRENTPEAVAEWEKVTEAAVESGKAAAQATREAAAEQKAALEDERQLRKAIAEGERAARADEDNQLNRQGEANEPSREEMQVARRQAAVNDYKRASERAMQASMQADLARTGPGRMGVMQRQQIMRQYKAMGNMRRGTGGGRMGIMQRQLAAKAGFGGDRERLAVDAVQKQYDTTKELKEAVELLRSEGIQAYL
jgi:hypothetical protein